jgi:hypothetical protein
MKNKNFIYIKDNFFSKKECIEVINKFNNNLIEGPGTTGYFFNKIFSNNFILDHDFINKFALKYEKEINIYKKKYPEINLTSSHWNLTDLTFKKFEKNKYFSNFHSEHSLLYPNRVLSVQIYLSNHNCGTKFYRSKEVILSKMGRLAIFPAYFTHTHCGQKCKENKERFILTGYVSFVNFGERERGYKDELSN